MSDAHVRSFEADGYTSFELPMDAETKARLCEETVEARCNSDASERFSRPYKLDGTRSDYVAFCTAEEVRPLCPAIAGVIDVLGALAAELSRRLRTDDAGTLLAPSACQFANYPPTAKYEAHRDTPLKPKPDGERENERAVTLICYLNATWDTARDGGALRIYPDAGEEADQPNGPRGRYVDVTPRVGNVVVFRSSLLHEVMPNLSTDKRRCAITMWTCSMV